MIETNALNDLKDIFHQSPKELLILTHKNPDGDAVGSSLGLMHFLSDLGHNCKVLVPNNFPVFLSWLPGAESIYIFEKDQELGKALLNKADVIFCLDFNSLSRISVIEQFIRATTCRRVLIDHHPQPDNDFDIKISNTGVSSTAELVYHAIEQCGFGDKISSNMATCFYTGIMTDTGNFSHNSSQPETFQAASALLSKGIDKDRIYSGIFHSHSFNRMRLMGYSLNDKLKYFPEFNTAYISLSLRDLESFGFQPGDTEGFVNLPLSIDGVKFSALFIEKEELIKVSLRSKGNFDVNALARKHFKGGGHKNAAGGESRISLDGTLQKFEKLLLEYNEELS